MKVYHFLKTEFALDDLRNRRIKISRLNELNDPFELVAANHSRKEQRQIWGDWRREQIRKWGLICFSRTWKNPVLWSHYAESHKGMCLGFEVPDRNLIQVHYTRKRLNLDIEKLYDEGKLNQEHMIKIFRTKYKDWGYEEEVRVYARLEFKDPDTGLYFHDFNDEMKLTDVYAGPLCEESEENIRANLQSQESGVKVIRTRLAFNTFEVCIQQRGF